MGGDFHVVVVGNDSLCSFEQCGDNALFGLEVGVENVIQDSLIKDFESTAITMYLHK